MEMVSSRSKNSKPSCPRWVDIWVEAKLKACFNHWIRIRMVKSPSRNLPNCSIESTFDVLFHSHRTVVLPNFSRYCTFLCLWSCFLVQFPNEKKDYHRCAQIIEWSDQQIFLFSSDVAKRPFLHLEVSIKSEEEEKRLTSPSTCRVNRVPRCIGQPKWKI